eukprot:TRINITY_DN91656_c0_g1_i3.p3 TRINITY_DN91656_c0_g1~~TRINITY_DN91656_c0_g1_i3.p3  ORF type:complete len:169 (-),score=21.17 TRINITY_DN91656_c0_g1_i3:217-723(-)
MGPSSGLDRMRRGGKMNHSLLRSLELFIWLTFSGDGSAGDTRPSANRSAASVSHTARAVQRGTLTQQTNSTFHRIQQINKQINKQIAFEPRPKADPGHCHMCTPLLRFPHPLTPPQRAGLGKAGGVAGVLEKGGFAITQRKAPLVESNVRKDAGPLDRINDPINLVLK